MSDRYDMIDRFLRNNLDDDDYAEFSQALNDLCSSAPTIPAGYAVLPQWKGYALLGTGEYVINHTPTFDPELGAELAITFATEDDRTGGRKIGESRQNPDDADPIQPDDIVIRIGFLSERALFALEDQLHEIRKTHWPETLAASPKQGEPA